MTRIVDVRAKPYSSRRERGQGWVETPLPPLSPEEGGRKCWGGLLGSLKLPYLGCSACWALGLLGSSCWGLLLGLRVVCCSACWAPSSTGTQVGRPPSGGKQKVSTRILIRTPLLGRWLRRISITFIVPNWAGSRFGVPSQGYSPTSGRPKVQFKILVRPFWSFDWGRFVWRPLSLLPHCLFPPLPITTNPLLKSAPPYRCDQQIPHSTVNLQKRVLMRFVFFGI